jgi:hypothetical protein
MAQYFCKSGFCDRIEGFAFHEIENYFMRDRSLVCNKCKQVQHRIDHDQAVRDEELRAEQQRTAAERRARLLDVLAQERVRGIDKVMRALGEPNLVLERSLIWEGGPQHLGGPFYRCPGPDCIQPRRDPIDFTFIYRAGKKPLFNGDTVCDDCFAGRLDRFALV